jgi:two-component system CheB/CheR fusion protein
VCPATGIPLQQVQDGRLPAVYSPLVALVPPLSSSLAWLTEFEDGIGPMKNSGSRKVAAVRKRPKSEPNPLAARIFHPPGEFPIVGVGASAGGLEAFSELLRHLPEKTGMAFVLVQHLDPTHGSMLKEILGRITKIPVTEVTDGLVVAPDHIYVIPANTIMFIEHGVLRLNARLQTRGLYLPIDHFFQSLALDRGNQAICVILSGTGSDGSAGCTAIKTAGGIGFAQDDQSAKYSSMPHSAIHAGSVDFVLSPQKIAKELTRIGQHPYVARPIGKKDEPLAIAAGSDLAKLLFLVRDTSGVDFSLYKHATLQRRINRRMVLHRLDTLKDYLRYIKGHPGELGELCQDILIHVTGFYRDPEAFAALRKYVFPSLFQARQLDDNPIRIWIPGCSTGEEVYSIAMVLLEYMWERARRIPLPFMNPKAVQIFATDISDSALERGRSGRYAQAAVVGVSPNRLERFFVKVDGGYEINKTLREMCIFAKQNVAKDPPFSNLDLISCRNLLIYFGTALQKRVIPTFHYALKSNGFLLLGGAESLGTFMDHFTLVDEKYKVYQKRSSARLITYFAGPDHSRRKLPDQKAPRTAQLQGSMTIDEEVERVLMNRFVPASIVVNDNMEIVQFRGRTGFYLEPAAGQPTFRLSKMARQGLLPDLRAALSKAKKDNTTVRKEGVLIEAEGGTREVNLEVIPVQGQGLQARLYAVVFQDAPRKAAQLSLAKRAPKNLASGQSWLARENARLSLQLTQLREQFQSLIEENDTTSEEFKSANEEVLSSNEELQSTNEELETAKEELQSSNEELTTLNEELQDRNSELGVANNDLLNLLNNVNLAVVMVADDLRIRRFTPLARKLLNLIPADIGRRLGEIRPNVDLDNLDRIVRETIDTAIPHECEVRGKNAGWYLMRVRPYETSENKVEGAVISFQDIDVLKRQIDEMRTFADTLVENAREAILVLDHDLRVTLANRVFYAEFRVFPEETEGRQVYDLGDRQWNIPRLRELLEKITKTRSRIDDFEMQHNFPQLGFRTMLLNARRVEPQGARQVIILSITDVTQQRMHSEEWKRQAALLELTHDSIIVRDFDGRILFWNPAAEKMYEWKREDAIGKVSHELLQTEFPKSLAEINAEFLRTGRWEGELVHVCGDGRRKTVNSRWALRRTSEGTPEVLEINSDITARRSSEDSLRQLSGYLMRVQDEERRRIARELHDSTGQKLIALKMNLEALRIQPNAAGETSGLLQQSVELVDETTQDIRTLAQLLHPPLLDEAGLISATRWLVDGFSQRAGIAIELVVPPEMGRLPENAEIALFRVIQESLNNVHRHAAAKKARIEIKRTPEAVTLEVSDDGKGLRPELGQGTKTVKPSFGVGILGMRERLSQLGGTLEISSKKKGTTVKAVLPSRQRPS